MALFPRKKAAAADDSSTVLVKPGGKGRATPKRSQARASRPVAPYLEGAPKGTRKENSKLDRDRRRGSLDTQRAAMKGLADVSKLPLRDRRPEAAFARNFVDQRRNLVTLVLVAYALLFVSLFAHGIYILNTLMLAVMFVAIVDAFVLAFVVNRAMHKEFPGSNERIRIYAVQRALMPRRMRLPRPGVGISETLARSRRR